MVEAGRWFEQVVEGQSVGEELVDGQRVVQIELGRFVGEVRLVESQFVAEPVVGRVVVFEQWAGFGWWTGSVEQMM